MLLVKDKWDEYIIENERGDEFAALDLLRDRVAAGWWYHGHDQQVAKAIVRAKDAPGALAFLLARRDYEYEWVEVTTPKQVP